MTLSTPLSRQRAAGFTLVEVALSIGLVAFALVGILGLMPIGLSNFREAMDASVSSMIVQKIASEVQQADAQTLVAGSSFAVRYFDDQGSPVSEGSQARGQSRKIYHAAYGVQYPAGIAGSHGQNLAKVTIDVVNNPGGHVIARDGATGGFLPDSSNGIYVSRYTCYVAINQ